MSGSKRIDVDFHQRTCRVDRRSICDDDDCTRSANFGYNDYSVVFN
jgi:hypothetical protein